MENSAETIDSYIARFPDDIRKLLKNVQFTIRKAAPDAVETIKYGMPTYLLNGNLIFFAGYPTHISVYPRTPAMEKVKDKIARYESGRGTLKFPVNEPIPYGLIGEITAIRVAESRAEAEEKAKAEASAKPAKPVAKGNAKAKKGQSAEAKPAKKKAAKKVASKKAAPRKATSKKAAPKKAAPKKAAPKKAAPKKVGRKKARRR